MKFFVVGFIVFIGLTLVPEISFCQPAGGGPATPSVPITGIEVLIAVGGALGIRKLMIGRKKTS